MEKRQRSHALDLSLKTPQEDADILKAREFFNPLPANDQETTGDEVTMSDLNRSERDTQLEETQREGEKKEEEEEEGEQPLLDPQGQVSPDPGQSGEGDSGQEDSKESYVTYDAVLTSLGEFGRHQKLMFLLLGCLYASGAIQILITVFSLAVPDHRCALPDVANDTWRIQSPHHASLLNLTIPPSSSPSSPYDSCHLSLTHQPQTPVDLAPFSVNGNGSESAENRSALDASLHNIALLNSSSFHTVGGMVAENGEKEGGVNGSGRKDGGGKVTCERYVYDTSTFESSITSELDLVCGGSLYRSHLLMLLMLGNLAGLQPAGVLSDLLGRRPVMMLSIVLHLVTALAISWAENLVLLMVLLFLMGLSIPGVLCSNFIMCMEMVGPSYRKWTGYGQMTMWSLGMIGLAGLAYGLREWRHLQLASALLILPFLSFYWLIPESPRWLISRGRRAEAEAILQKTARINGRSLPAAMLAGVMVEKDMGGVSIFRACASPVLMMRCAILFFAWLVNSLTFYGLNWTVSSLHGNIYVNFLLMGLVEVLANGGCFLLLDRVGRRRLNCGLMLLAGVTCTATYFPVQYGSPSSQWVTVLLALLGKLGITGSFNTIWIFSSELFPTVLRTSGMASCSMCSRLGGILAPYIANLGVLLGGEAKTALPLSIYGVLSMVAGLLLLLLPETLHYSLPNTVEDAVAMDRKKRAPNKLPL